MLANRDMNADEQRFDIEGQNLGYPTQFRDGSSALGLFVVPSRTADALIADSGFEVAKIGPGRAVLSLACVHYTDSDCGVYNEISLAFFVKTYGKAAGLPYIGTWYDIVRGQAVNHTWRLPVTTKLANDAGVLMWGFPKTVEDIDFELSGGRATFTLHMDGTEVLSYSVRAAGKRHQAPVASPVYSIFEGVPQVSYLTQEYRDMGVRIGGGRLSLGDHPIGDELRGLGLPRRPLVASWMGHLSFEMSAPEKL